MKNMRQQEHEGEQCWWSLWLAVFAVTASIGFGVRLGRMSVSRVDQHCHGAVLHRPKTEAHNSVPVAPGQAAESENLFGANPKNTWAKSPPTPTQQLHQDVATDIATLGISNLASVSMFDDGKGDQPECNAAKLELAQSKKSLAIARKAMLHTLTGGGTTEPATGMAGTGPGPRLTMMSWEPRVAIIDGFLTVRRATWGVPAVHWFSIH
jgi:hypothetical protein